MDAKAKKDDKGGAGCIFLIGLVVLAFIGLFNAAADARHDAYDHAERMAKIEHGCKQ